MNGLGCLLSIAEVIAWGFIFVLLWKASPEPSTGEKIFNGILFTIMVAFGGYLLYKEIKKMNKEFAGKEGDNQKDSSAKSRKVLKKTAYYTNRELPGVTLSSYEEVADNQTTPNGNSYYVSLVRNPANDTYRIDVNSETEYAEFMQKMENQSLTIVADRIYPSKIIAASIRSALRNAFSSKKIGSAWFQLDQQDVQQIIDTLK